jgi:hypothetical protein
MPWLGKALFLSAGAVFAAQRLRPDAGSVVRSLAKALIRKGLVVSEAVQELMAEGNENLSDLVAEVKAERAAANTPSCSKEQPETREAPREPQKHTHG